MKYQLGNVNITIENKKVSWCNDWSKLFHLEHAGYFTHTFIGPCFGDVEYHPTSLFYTFAKEI